MAPLCIITSFPPFLWHLHGKLQLLDELLVRRWVGDSYGALNVGEGRLEF
jgi:hypothetical protein